MPDSIQNVRIKFTREGTGLADANKELQNLTEAERNAVKGFEAMNTAASNAGSSVKKNASDGNAELTKTTGIINNLKQNIQQLQTARDKSNDPAKIKIYNDAITAQNAKLKTLTSSTDELTKKGTALSSTFKTVGTTILAAFSVGAVIGFGKQIFNITSEFEKLRAVLTNTLGSQSLADTALSKIKKLAVETNFSVVELTNAYVKLANSGFEPTVDQLRALADLTNSTGKTFDQLAEAVLDANTDQFIRLKEFGIKASREGDKISFIFKGVRTEVNRNSTDITNYLVGLGKLNGVMGTTAAISQTLSGKYSNLGDSFDQLLDTLGSARSGFFRDVLQGFTNLTNAVADFARTEEQARAARIGDKTIDRVSVLTKKLTADLEEQKKAIGNNEAKLAEFYATQRKNYEQKQENSLQTIEDLNDEKKRITELFELQKKSRPKDLFGNELAQDTKKNEKANLDYAKSIAEIDKQLINAEVNTKSYEQAVHDVTVIEKQAALSASETERLKKEAYEKGKARREKAFNDAKSELDQAEQNAQRISALEGGGTRDSLKIAEDFNEKRKALFVQHNKDIGADYEELFIREREIASGLTSFEKRQYLERLEAAKKLAEERKEIDENIEKDRISAIDHSLAVEQNKVNTQFNFRLEKQAELFKSGEISADQYNENISKINDEAQEKSLIDEIIADQEKLKILKVGSTERLSVEQNLLDNKRALLQLDVDATAKAEKEKEELAKKRAANIKLVEQKVLEVSLGIIKALFDANQQKIATQISDLKGQEKEEIEAIKQTSEQGKSIREKARDKELADNVEDKEKQKEINAVFKAQEKEDKARQAAEEQAIKDKFAKKDLELRIKAAKSKKDEAYFEAALGVAKGIVNATAVAPPYGFILGALVAAEGAIQIAAIKSQPLPKFFKGTESLELNGNPSGVDTIPILANKGERIVPTAINEHLKGIPNADLPKLAELWRRNFDYQGITKEVINGRSGGQQDTALLNEMKAVNKKLDTLKVANITIDKNGIKTFITTKHSEVEYVNNYFRT